MEGSNDYLQVVNPTPLRAGLRQTRQSETSDVRIPVVPRAVPSTFEKILSFVMSGGAQRSTAVVGKPLVYFTTVFVSLGVFLFGYDQGVMSGIITGQYFNETFDYPSRAKLGTMVAILEVGAFISSIAVGRVGDLIGRRRTISYGACVFTMGGLIQTMSSGMVSMIIGRFTAGIGVGLLSTIVPIYQSEISPADHRGSLACIEFTGNIIGYASSVWIDYFASFIPSNMSWRLPLFMQCVMGFLLTVGSLAIVESPRWLLDHDHDIEGLTVLANLLAKGDTDSKVARDEFRSIKQGVLKQRVEGEMSYGEMWRRYKKRVLIAMSSQAFAQLNGINVISYYAPLVFEQAGWVGRDALLMTGINGLVYVASTIPPWYAIDYLGRRFILLSGAVVMCVALSSISCVMYLDKWYTADLVVALVIIYNASFGASWGPVPWLYPPEILPLTIRAKGASLSTATNWAFNFLVGEGTPVLQQAIKWKLYLIHAASCAVSFAVVWFFYPETKGVALEEMDVLFGDTVQDDEETASLVRSGRSSMDVTPVRSTPDTPSTPSRVGTPSDGLARGFIVKMKSGMQRMALSRQNSDYERLGNGDQQS